MGSQAVVRGRSVRLWLRMLALMLAGLATTKEAKCQEAVDSSPAQLVVASAVGTTLGIFPGALAGVVIARNPVGLAIGGGVGMWVGSSAFLAREGLSSPSAMRASTVGLLAAGLAAVVIDAEFGSDGAVLIAIPATHALVTGLVGWLWH